MPLAAKPSRGTDCGSGGCRGDLNEVIFSAGEFDDKLHSLN